MPSDPTLSSLWASSQTATSDVQFRLTTDPAVILEEVNVHISGFGVYYGPAYNVSALAPAGSVITMPKTRAADWWFKNAVAGSNATVTMVGSLKGVV